MERKRVVITGISVIASDSYSKEQLWRNLNDKHFHVVPIDESCEKNYKFKSRFYVPFPEIKIEDYGFSSRYNILMEDNSRIAIVCAKTALEDAGYKLEKNEKGGFRVAEIEESGAIIGTGLGSLDATLGSYVQHAFNHLDNPETKAYRFNKMTIPITMPNSSAAWISILLGLKGESYTVNTACSSANYAIGQAFRKIKYGESKMMISGGVECLKDKVSAVKRGFDTLGTLTTSPYGKPQPFSKNRSGFLFSEGAGSILILEELEYALNRNADIYAEIVDCKFSNDAYNIVQMDESATQIKKMLTELIKDFRIDYINSHGTGTVLNDKIEAALICDLFGGYKTQPFINSTKSMIGHSLGASAAIEASVTAMSIKYQQIHPNLSENNMDDLNLVTEPMNADIGYAISSSFGFGGHNSAVLFKKYN